MTEVGTDNINSKARRKMRDLIFLISDAQRNFLNKLFDSVETQSNSAIAEQHFRLKLKRKKLQFLQF